ncbi:MAG: hypothetical protein WDM79_16305 [Terricaulis sp.]
MTPHLLDAMIAKPLEGGPSFSLRHRIFRLAWSILWATTARWLPGAASPVRVLLLRLFGAKVSWQAAIGPGVDIWYPPNLTLGARSTLADNVNCYNMAPIIIGERVIVSQRVFLCAGSHDVDSADFQLVTAPITIGARAWIAAEAMIGPGVTVGEGAVLGARAVAFSDLVPWTIYVGNPAKSVRKRRIFVS